MARELERLAEEQREVVRALAALTEVLRSSRQDPPAAERPGTVSERSGALPEPSPVDAARLERALEVTSRAVTDLEATTAANAQVLAEVGRQVTALPGLLGGLVDRGKDKSGGGLAGFFKGGFGLASLFRRRREPEPAALTSFAEPARLALEAANTENILAGFPRVIRGQTGEPRAAAAQTPVWQPQVTVNVNAIDSRSFLDHSAEITRAVREAMLHMHPVNDLISEL